MYPASYTDTSKLNSKYPNLLHDSVQVFARRKKVGSIIGHLLVMIPLLAIFLGPLLYFEVNERRLKIDDIRRKITSEEIKKSDTNLESDLLRLRDLSFRLESEDSITLIKNLSEEILLLGAKISENLQKQRDEIKVDYEIIRLELDQVREETEKLKEIESIQETSKYALREFYVAEIVRASRSTFWLGVGITLLLQVIAIILAPFVQVRLLPSSKV